MYVHHSGRKERGGEEKKGRKAKKRKEHKTKPSKEMKTEVKEGKEWGRNGRKRQ